MTDCQNKSLFIFEIGRVKRNALGNSCLLAGREGPFGRSRSSYEPIVLGRQLGGKSKLVPGAECTGSALGWSGAYRTGWGFPVLVLLQLGLLERLIGIRLECLIGLLHFQVAGS